jgi:hypothetical protein
VTLELRDVPNLPDPNITPPTVAQSGDPFASLRVAHLVARLPRATPIRLRDIVDRLNAEYVDWSFSRPVVAAALVQLHSNWTADFRTQNGFDLADGPAGEELTIEDSGRVEPWLVRQVARYADECVAALRAFARDEGSVP